MDKLVAIYLHGRWGDGLLHTTATFGYDENGQLVWACSCGSIQGQLPSLRD